MNCMQVRLHEKMESDKNHFSTKHSPKIFGESRREVLLAVGEVSGWVAGH